jgi:hypothetical protein
MRAIGLNSLVVFYVSLVVSIHACAQPLSPHANSIESTVSNADVVFIAKIEKFELGKQADGRKGHAVTIVITETLKRNLFGSGPQPRMQVHFPHSESVLTDWKKRSCRLLVAYDEFAPRATTVIELAKGKMKIMTADLKLLREPEAVIEAARKAVLLMPAAVKRVNTFKLTVPLENVVGTKWERYYKTGGQLLLSVPVDKRLEKRSLNYIRSKIAQKRAEGARALRYFKSDKNIAILKPLLADSKPTYVQSYKGIEQRVYGVRYQAYATLKAWGLEIKKPVIREEVRK